MSFRVVFSPEAVQQLTALYEYIADAASPNTAAHYTEALVCFCEGLSTFPHWGTLRDDVRPGLRVTHYKKRAVIAFAVDRATEQLVILGLFYGGQNYEFLLQADAEGLPM